MGKTLAELLRRKTLQVLGIYLAAAWGLLEFTDWAVQRFELDAPLVTVVLTGLALLLPVVVWGAWRIAGQAPPSVEHEPPPRSVAVLPFVTLGNGAETEYLGFGLADHILNDLTKIGDLRVVARTSSFAHGGKEEDVRVMGRRLGAGAILEGTVQRSGDRLRVTTQLVSARDGYHLWSERYERKMEDVFAIQDDIARQVARVLDVLLHKEVEQAVGKVHTRVVGAYEAYVRGRQFFLQTRRKSLEYARDMFLKAIALDEDFALAHAAVADVAAMLYTYYPAVQADLPGAALSARRALELDPGLAEAHSANGAVLFAMGKLSEAEGAFARAIELDPRNFDARYFHARACFQQGRFEEAAELFRSASNVQEDYQASFFVAQSLEGAGHHDEALVEYAAAEEVARRHMDLNPDDPRAATMLAVSLCRLGRQPEGLQWAERALTIDREDAGVRYNAACLFALAGEHRRAIDCLEEAVAVGFGNREWLKHDPDLDGLRGDPTFERLVDAL
jgi:TolB-like protein/Flp pilus assembly protein TadD